MRKVKAAVAFLLGAATVLSMGGCLKYTSNIYSTVSTTGNGNEYTTAVAQPATTDPYSQYTTNPMGEITTAEPNTIVIITPESTTAEATTVPGAQAPSTTAPQAETTTNAPEVNPSQWTKSQIVTYTTNAINKTKDYKGNITAYHKESMNATVTNCPGGNMVKNLANKIIESAIKPTDQTLNFSNGTTVSQEGETLQFLLPKADKCTIPEASVASATASKSGNTITVNIKLKQETATINTLPTANSQCFGYLDINSVDLSMINLTTFNTTYQGSTMEVKINADTGYVISAVYTIPVDIQVAGKAMGISAEIGVSANQVEYWTINW